jgi:hypothetical protein
VYPLEGLKIGGVEITPPMYGPPWIPWNPPSTWPPPNPPRADASVASVPINKAATAKTVRLRFMGLSPSSVLRSLTLHTDEVASVSRVVQ